MPVLLQRGMLYPSDGLQVQDKKHFADEVACIKIKHRGSHSRPKISKCWDDGSTIRVFKSSGGTRKLQFLNPKPV